MDIEKFIKHYITAALWSSNDDDGTPLDQLNYPLSDQTLIKMRNDCIKFCYINDIDELEESEQQQAAHDFWLTRNNHGSGFNDGHWDDALAKKFGKSAHAFGPFDLYVGDDKKIHV